MEVSDWGKTCNVLQIVMAVKSFVGLARQGPSGTLLRRRCHLILVEHVNFGLVLIGFRTNT
jgi:hypothetical protein